MTAAVIWLIVGVLLVVAELLSGEFVLLMLGGGALAAAGVSLFVGGPVVGGVVFAVVSVLLLLLVRPALRRHFLSGKGLPEPAKALEGKSALVLDRVGRHEGQVKLEGDVWTARPLNENDVYEPGDHVTVVQIDGATAVVQKVM